MEEETQKVRKKTVQNFFLIALILAGVGIFFLLQTKDASFNRKKASSLTKGLPAPRFTLPGLDGNMVSLAEHKGNVVLLHIWATWCPPCVKEMPSLEKLYQELKHEEFKILAVSIDETGSQAIAPFMKKHKLNFPALTDTKGITTKLYQTTGVPESFIIDKEGKIVEKMIGPQNWDSPDAFRYIRRLIRSK